MKKQPKISQIRKFKRYLQKGERHSDQFGPENDHYEIPESALRSEHPGECSLLLSYIDGRGGKADELWISKNYNFMAARVRSYTESAVCLELAEPLTLKK